MRYWAIRSRARRRRMAAQVVRRLFTVEEYYKMAKAGILHEDDRVELIEGEIVDFTRMTGWN
jgi:N-acetylneuraminic acid mutarotase